MPRTTPPRGTQAVIRAIRLLKAFSPEQPELSLSQLGASIALTKTTTHRLLTALESEGLVARTTGGTYRLGPSIRARGSQAKLPRDLRAAVRPTRPEKPPPSRSWWVTTSSCSTGSAVVT